MDWLTMLSTNVWSWSSVRLMWKRAFMLATVEELDVKQGSWEPEKRGFKNCFQF